MPDAPPVPVLFPAVKLKRFRTLDDDAYPLTTYLANEEAQTIISEGFESVETRDGLDSFLVCQKALAKFPFCVDAFIEVAYLFETYFRDLGKTKTAYEHAIKCCEYLWPNLEQIQAQSETQLHEAKLLQQAVFGLANVELELGNYDVALQHIATLQNHDPDDILGNRLILEQKYNSIVNPTAVPSALPGQDVAIAASAASSLLSDTDSFYDDSYSDESGSSGSIIETERSIEDLEGKNAQMCDKKIESCSPDSEQSTPAHVAESCRRHGQGETAIEQTLSTRANTNFPLADKQEPCDGKQLEDSITAASAMDSSEALCPSQHHAPSSLRKIHRYMNKSMVDKTMAKSYFLSASVSLENGDIDAALEHVRSLLKADPRDECGCLWKFFERFVRANFEEEDIEQILSGGPSSAECYFRYCFIILDVMKLESGDSTVEKVNETIVKALSVNPLVPHLLLSEQDLPECLTQQVPGGMSEAIWYVKTDRDTWEGVQEAGNYLNGVRFLNGPKPSDEGQILRSLLSHYQVIIDLDVSDFRDGRRFECTTRRDHAEHAGSMQTDSSILVCYAIPVALDREGRRLEGRYISFSWSDVERVHFWSLLHEATAVLEKDDVLQTGSSLCHDERMRSDDIGSTRAKCDTHTLAPDSTDQKSRMDHEIASAERAISMNEYDKALDHIRNILDYCSQENGNIVLKLFRSFVRSSCVKDKLPYLLRASRDNAEVFFRWRLVITDKKRLDIGLGSPDDLDETIVRALESNASVPTFLLRGEEPEKFSGPFDSGSMQEAAWYVHSDINAWKNAPEALEVLLLSRFRDGLKPQDDGALLVSLLERCKVLIDIFTKRGVMTYSCCSVSDSDRSPAALAKGNDSGKFVCFAVPTMHTTSTEGRWISFTYQSVEKIPFWKILIDSKYLLTRDRSAFTKPSLLRDGSISDLSVGSSTSRDSMLRRTLQRSSLSNSSVLSDRSVSFPGSVFSSSTKNIAATLREREAAFESAEKELKEGNIDEAMGYIRRLFDLDPQNDSSLVTKIFQLFVEQNFEEDEADHILALGRESAECFFRYSFVILDHMRRALAECSTRKLENTLTEAIQTNPFVPDLILEKNIPPMVNIQPIPGQLSEAIFYVNADAGTWSCVKGALEWLRKTRFRNGLKPNDDGTVLKDLLRHGKVIVEIKLSGDETITYLCTNHFAESDKPAPPNGADHSKIICHATPAELGFRGQPRTGKYIAFSYSSVQSIHYWNVLHSSRVFAKRRESSSHTLLNASNSLNDWEESSVTEPDYEFTQSSEDPCFIKGRREPTWLSSVIQSKKRLFPRFSSSQAASPRQRSHKSPGQLSPVKKVSSLREKFFSTGNKRVIRSEV